MLACLLLGHLLGSRESSLLVCIAIVILVFHGLLMAAEGSMKSGGSRKVDPKCPNAGNPFHECSEYCATKMQQVEQHRSPNNMKSPRRKGSVAY
jgi:hypothetical protein